MVLLVAEIQTEKYYIESLLFLWFRLNNAFDQWVLESA